MATGAQPGFLDLLMNFLKGQNQTQSQVQPGYDTSLTNQGVGTYHYQDPRIKLAQAYSRITQTPIYYNPDLPQDRGGQYDAGSGLIETHPESMMSRGHISHESAHAIFDKANLYDLASKLSSDVPVSATGQIAFHPELYPNMNDDKMLANEGLAFSIGDPTGTAYINKVASKIQDIRLRGQLLRLHDNALQANRLAQHIIDLSGVNK